MVGLFVKWDYPTTLFPHHSSSFQRSLSRTTIRELESTPHLIPSPLPAIVIARSPDEVGTT
ncbi:MAG: hypothetical protein MUO99_02400, partial [Dehalococcoidales bacterium]|nr:hypothetical protein [Dehalococcoidales bacterium]